MTRHAITDDQWECSADRFPSPPKSGRPPMNRRTVIDAILWILRAGSSWRGFPEEAFGTWDTVHGLFNAWNAGGLFDENLQRLQTAHVDVGMIDEQLWCVNGTVIRAHWCAAGGGKKRIQKSCLITH